MPVILSMKTFQKLEEKLGSEAAKEVYQLAEAIYEEVEKKNEEKLGQYQLRIKDSGENVVNKADLTEFRKEMNATLVTVMGGQLGELQEQVKKVSKTFSRITVLLLINLAAVLVIFGYLIIPVINSG